MGKKQKTNGGDAVIYARYSSHNQRDVSIEQQVEACRKHAAELGLTVTATYEDRATSRTTASGTLTRISMNTASMRTASLLPSPAKRLGGSVPKRSPGLPP